MQCNDASFRGIKHSFINFLLYPQNIASYTLRPVECYRVPRNVILCCFHCKQYYFVELCNYCFTIWSVLSLISILKTYTPQKKVLHHLHYIFLYLRPSGSPLHILSKLYDVHVGLVPLSSLLRLCIALFAVAEGWLLLDIGWFVLFLKL